PVQVDGVAHRVLPEHLGMAGGGPQQSEQDADRGGLAGAVRAEQAVHLTGGDGQVQPVQCADLAVVLDEVLDVDDGGHQGAPSGVGGTSGSVGAAADCWSRAGWLSGGVWVPGGVLSPAGGWWSGAAVPFPGLP